MLRQPATINRRNSRLIALLIGLIVVGIMLPVIGAVRGPISDTTARLVLAAYGPIATLILVLVTWQYVKQNEQLLAETQIDRVQESIAKLIVYGIDPLLSQLRNDQSVWSNPTVDGREPYPELELQSQFFPPEEGVVNDLESEYPSLQDDIDQYFELRREYDQHRSELYDQLEEEIPWGLSNASIKGIEKALHLTDRDELNDDECQIIAHIILELEEPTRSKGWISDHFERLRRAVVDIRDDPKVADQFDELQSLLNGIKEKNHDFVSKLESTRNDLKDNYDIVEPDILEVEQGKEWYEKYGMQYSDYTAG